MLELFKSIDWDDYIEILMYGNPPIWVQLSILIGLAFAITLWRIIGRKRPMSKGNKLKYKLMFVLAFGLILFQEAFNLRGMMDQLGF